MLRRVHTRQRAEPAPPVYTRLFTSGDENHCSSRIFPEYRCFPLAPADLTASRSGCGGHSRSPPPAKRQRQKPAGKRPDVGTVHAALPTPTGAATPSPDQNPACEFYHKHPGRSKASRRGGGNGHSVQPSTLPRIDPGALEQGGRAEASACFFPAPLLDGPVLPRRSVIASSPRPWGSRSLDPCGAIMSGCSPRDPRRPCVPPKARAPVPLASFGEDVDYDTFSPEGVRSSRAVTVDRSVRHEPRARPN
jgi:hypothetical protein